MYKNGVELRVCVNGRPVREYSHKGQVFVESRHGTNYSIRIKNDNGFRVMATVSVDGINVITGKPAAESSTGYIVPDYDTTEIKGYRISDDKGAEFVFSSKGESYSTDVVGTAKDCGVIGIRITREKEPVQIAIPQPVITTWPNPPMPMWVTPDLHPYSGAAWCGPKQGSTGGVLRSMKLSSGPSAAVYAAQVVNSSISDLSAGSTARSLSFDTGTAWGNEITDKVRKEAFEKGAPLGDLILYYSSRNALVDMGIDLEQRTAVTSDPELPKAFGNTGYCTPPKQWKR